MNRFLVTSTLEDRMKLWLPMAGVTNWIEGRVTSEDETRETWLVMLTSEDGYRKAFLDTARKIGNVTVQEIHIRSPLGSEEPEEEYVLLVGEPGTGWNGPSS